MIDERVVDRWLSRGHRFFRAMRQEPIRARLMVRGLTNEELVRGWGLYAAVMGQDKASTVRVSPPSKAASAMAELDAWDAPNFNVAAAVLHPAPKAAAFLFANLEAATGPDAVVAVETFLDRWERLAKNQAEGVPEAEARRAVERLDSRRVIDVQKARHLRELIRVAKEGVQPSQTLQVAQAAAVEVDEAAFRDYKAWLREWREVARATFERRDYLISLGLASRRSGDDEDDDENPAPGGQPTGA